jgi:cytidine deaminase
MPCGACRQFLSEFGLEAVVVVADAEGNILRQTTVRDLLPEAFGPTQLQ